MSHLLRKAQSSEELYFQHEIGKGIYAIEKQGIIDDKVGDQIFAVIEAPSGRQFKITPV